MQLGLLQLNCMYARQALFEMVAIKADVGIDRNLKGSVQIKIQQYIAHILL